ncbi:DUF4402 domain-containing protein [Brevundimonas vesicularis]|uniref:DUF4402 domain-containing protein n=1 Tax=Brevundimonas vesicularis TaxID=41276 RepID=UPI0038D4E2A2
MNRFALVSALAVTAFGLAGTASAQSSSSASGQGSITVIRPLTVSKSADMKFGTVVRPSTGSGSVIISNAGARTVSGGAVALNSGDTPQAAQFNIEGEGGQSVSVTIPATFSMINGAESLTVTTNNSLGANASAQTLSNALGSAGTLNVRVGGTVALPSTAATGVYTGTFTVSAAYN